MCVVITAASRKARDDVSSPEAGVDARGLPGSTERAKQRHTNVIGTPIGLGRGNVFLQHPVTGRTLLDKGLKLRSIHSGHGTVGPRQDRTIGFFLEQKDTASTIGAIWFYDGFSVSLQRFLQLFKRQGGRRDQPFSGPRIRVQQT